MNKIRWRDNGILLACIGITAIAIITVAELTLQGYTPPDNTIVVDVVVDSETDSDENSDEFVALSDSDTKLARSISNSILGDETVIDWQTVKNDFPLASTTVWLEVGRIACKRRQYDNCKGIFSALLQAEPNNIDVLFQLAKLESKLDNDKAAVDFYQQLLHLQPNHQSSLINLGLALARLNRHREAIQVLRSAIDTSSGNRKAKALSIFATSLMASDDYAGAITAFKQSIEYRPRHAATWRKLAEALRHNNAGDDEIIDTLNQAISLRRDYELALHDRARYYWRMGELQAARDDLEQAREVAPDYQPVRWTLAHLYIALEKDRSAQREFRALQKLGLGTEEKRFIDGLNRMSVNDWDGATTAFSELREAGYDDPWLTYYTAIATATNDREQTPAALASLATLFNDPWLDSQARFATVDIYRQSKQYEEAAVLLRTLTTRFPRSYLFAAELGDLYLDQDQPKLAIPVLINAIALAEDNQLNDNRLSRFRLARAYNHVDDYDNAIATYQAYIQDYPHDQNAYYNLGLIYYKLDRITEAIDLYSQAIAIDPADTNVQYKLALIYFDQQRYDDATKVVNDILAEDPTHHDARELLVELYSAQQQWQQALAEVNRLQVLVPDSIPAQLLKSDVLKEQGQLQSAADILLALPDAELSGIALTKLYNIGVRSLKSGMLNLAETCNRVVLDHEPNHDKALVNLTETLNRQARYQETVQLLTENAAMLADNYKLTINLATAHYHLGNHQLEINLLEPLKQLGELTSESEQLLADSYRLN